MLKRLKTEWTYFTGSLRILRRLRAARAQPERTFSEIIQELADKHPNNIAFYFEDKSISYQQYNARANQISRWATKNNITKGDTVALMLPNSPDYLITWLGVIRAGGAAALLNTNLRGKSLAHCMNVVEAKRVIVCPTLYPSLRSALTYLDTDAEIWVLEGEEKGVRSLSDELAPISGENLNPSEKVPLRITDKALYIYTSGTTGLPKAANISHIRMLTIMHGFSAATNARPSDRIYVALPLYHSSGGVLATGTVLTLGGSVILKDTFSASDFWDDCVKYKATLCQYIGELCRYLLMQPEEDNDKAHNVRLACGNGLRPDIWKEFQTRFNLPHILEFYGSTEGNIVLLNLDSKPGAVGRIPFWAEKIFNTKIVRFDVEKEKAVRGADGFCEICDVGEVGEVIARVSDDVKNPTNRFDGYVDKEATQKKMLNNAFENGDKWFRSGDLMKRDEMGYYYFIDRVGDTYRWKGENVATSEVSEAMSVFPGVLEANIYGVRVPGHDGRAGMAALSLEEKCDLPSLYQHIHQELPPYACPLFLRVVKHVEATSTFKQRKIELVKQGFNPADIKSPLYFDDEQKGEYTVLTPDLYEKIISGKIRI